MDVNIRFYGDDGNEWDFTPTDIESVKISRVAETGRYARSVLWLCKRWCSLTYEWLKVVLTGNSWHAVTVRGWFGDQKA